MTITDKQIQNFIAGDTKVFRQLYDDMYHSLCLFAYKMISDEAVVADIVQEAFIKLWKQREKMDSLTGTKSYLYTIVRNAVLSHIRDTHTEQFKDGDEEKIFHEIDIRNQIIQEEVYKLIHQAVDQLPTQTGNIVRLSLKGLKNPEIAENLNISVNTVKTLKKNAYAELKIKLKDHIFALLILMDVLS